MGGRVTWLHAARNALSRLHVVESPAEDAAVDPCRRQTRAGTAAFSGRVDGHARDFRGCLRSRSVVGPMKRSNAPIFWSLFGAGGVLSALLAPVLVIITGIITPIGIWMPPGALAYDRVLTFSQHWIGKGLILAVISLFLFHAAHRIYHGLHDIGVHAGTGAMV